MKLRLTLALFCLLASATAAQADPLVVTITDAIRVAPADFIGAQVFSGMLTNTSGAAITVQHIGGQTTESGSGAAYVPQLLAPLTIQAGETVAADLFRVDVTGPFVYIAGTYSVNELLNGRFVSLGSAYWQLAAAGFGYPNQPLPEPVSLLLLGTGLACVAARRLRIRVSRR